MSAFRGERRAPAIFLRADAPQHWKGKARFARSGLDRAGDAPDDTALVDAPVELHDNLASPVVVNVFELVDVTCGERGEARVSDWFTRKRESRPTTLDRGGEFQCPRRTVLLHDLEELDHDLGHRADEDLALATLLRVVHRLWMGRRWEGRKVSHALPKP